MRFGLDRMHRLMTVLGLPQRRFASIHVVGTNGKSSTVRFCAAILERHGLRTGATRRRTCARSGSGSRWGRSRCSEAGLRRRGDARRAPRPSWSTARAEPDDQVTQFEALTAAAYHELARRGVEVAVIEAGLGGRFDATNVIPSKVQVLTSVGLEHTRWLGPTAIDIAEEKLAVVRDHGTLVVGRAGARGCSRWPSAWRPSAHATLVQAPPPAAAPLRAAGGFQRGNFAVAAAAAEAFLGRAARPGRGAARRGPDARARPRRAGGRRAAHRLRRRPQPGRRARAGRVARRGAGRPPPARGGDRRARGQGRRGHAARSCCRTFDRVVFTRSRNPRSLSPATLASLAEKLRRPARGDRGRPARGGGPRAGAGGPGRGRAGHRLDLPDRRPA